MFVLLLTMVGVGVLMVAIGLPLQLRKIGPNNWYGFRTKTSLAREDVWYETNAVCGYWLILSGVGSALAAVGAWLSDLPEGESVTVCVTCLLAGSLGSAVHPFLVQRRMTDPAADAFADRVDDGDSEERID